MKKLLLLTSALTLLGVPWANADVEVEIVNGSSSTGWLSLGANTCALPVLPDTCSTGTMTVGNYTVASDIGIMSNGTNPFRICRMTLTPRMRLPAQLPSMLLPLGSRAPSRELI